MNIKKLIIGIIMVFVILTSCAPLATTSYSEVKGEIKETSGTIAYEYLPEYEVVCFYKIETMYTNSVSVAMQCIPTNELNAKVSTRLLKIGE